MPSNKPGHSVQTLGEANPPKTVNLISHRAKRFIAGGIELELNGHILDNLSFYLNCAFLELRNKEGVPWGKGATDERAKHCVTAGLCFDFFENTLLILDYS